MNRLRLRYGLYLGMGRHCPARRAARVALVVLLVALGAWGAYWHDARAVAAQAHSAAMTARLATAEADRDDLIALLNGAAMYVQRPDGTRIYTHVETHQIEIGPLVAGLNEVQP